MTEPGPNADMSRDRRAQRRLVVVTGSGRSGTSTVAGTLKKLGLTVPQPEVEADSTNPRGFFEPRWVIDFHKRLQKRSGVRTLDARPDALTHSARTGSRQPVRDELASWLASVFDTDQVVVKDPRTFWFHELWEHASSEVGARLSYLTMLRHPTEVVGSRDAHYLKRLGEDERRRRETGILAGWVNVVLVSELVTRGRPRVFVPYPDLIEDWRPTMKVVAERLGLDVNTDLAGSEPHEVDEFIDSDLRRVRLTWDDLEVPAHLRELAERTWIGLSALAEDPDDGKAMAALDQARRDYDVMHAQSLALVHDAVGSQVTEARREARANTRRQVEAELAAAAGSGGTPREQARRVARGVVRRVRTTLRRA